MPASVAAQVSFGAGALTLALAGEKRDRRRRRIGKTKCVCTEYWSARGRTERPFGADICCSASDAPTVGNGSAAVTRAQRNATTLAPQSTNRTTSNAPPQHQWRNWT